MQIYERVAGETARDYAIRVLKDNIVSLGIAPGTLISENELAVELGLSRTPVREAIIDLSRASIIETLPQRGSYVALIDPKMVEESRFLRQVLDTAVIQVACEEATEENLSVLEENVQLQEFYLQKGQADKIYNLDNQFHKAIYTVAKKDIIFEMGSTIKLHFDRVRSLSVEAVKDMKIVSDHRGMLEAIKAGDKETAVALVKKHLSRYQVDEDRIRKEYPSYFKQDQDKKEKLEKKNSEG